MDQQPNDFEKMSESLEDRFDFLEAIAGTLTAKAYRAIDATTNQEVTVWRTRGPLRSSEISRFQQRLMALQRMPRVETILWCGVDSHNRGFAVLRAYDGRKVDCSASSKEEVEQRFDGCVTVVEALHDSTLTCGDICLDSFLLKDRGGVCLFAVLGDVALEHDDEDREFNPQRYVAFRPPEQRRGGVQPAFVDAFALARLGEGLSAVRIKDEDGPLVEPSPLLKSLVEATASEARRKEVSSVRLIRPSLDENEVGPGEAEELDDIADLQRAAEDKLDAPKEKKEGTTEDGGLDSGASPGASPAAVAGLLETFRNPSRVLVLALLNLVALGVLFYLYIEGRATAGHLQARQVSEVEKDKEFKGMLSALYSSEAATTDGELHRLLSETTDPGNRLDIFKVMTFRARRQGLGRTSDVVLGQLLEASDMGVFGSDDRSRALSRVLDVELSSNARLEEVGRLYQASPRLAVILAAASVLDTGEAETYRGLFAKAVAEQTGISQGGERNPYALMLLLPDVHDLFSEDIVALQENIPTADVAWLMDELGKQGSPEVSTAAQIAERRGLGKGPQIVFFRELRRSGALNPRIRSSIVSGALGKLSIDDVRRFNEWYGQGAPRVLEAAILTTPHGSLKRAAFDALSTKPIDEPYIAKLMEFVRSTYGDEASRFAEVVAALALREVVEQDSLARELDALQDAPRSQELLKRMVQGAPPEVIQIVLERYSDSMDQLDIVDLLRHPSSGVRVGAVSSLGKVNDIMLLKLISQSYDDETDPTVRAAYETHIAIVKDRLS
jgi:hypothetical protein